MTASLAVGVVIAVALTYKDYQYPAVNAAASTHPSATAQPPRLITKAELRRIVPYTPQHILRLEKRGLFPRRVQVGPNRVAWLLSEIEQWVEARIAERDCSLR